MTTADHPADGQAAAPADLQPLRRDAERNRERIVAAARGVFAADGIEASMASVARAAGVGIATLFRRFPTREDLIDAVFAGTMDAYVAAVTTALGDPDPWHGFTTYIHTVCAMQAADRGFAEVLTMTFPAATSLEDQRQRAYHGFLHLIDRAKQTGQATPRLHLPGPGHPAHSQRRRHRRHPDRRPRHLATPGRLPAPGLHRTPARHPPATTRPQCPGPRHGRPQLPGQAGRVGCGAGYSDKRCQDAFQEGLLCD